MKINHYINNRIAAAMMLLLSLFFLPACSNEEDVPEVEEPKYATMVISLGALDNSTPAYTKAAGDNDIIDPNYADDYFERYIKNWSIVVVNEDGVVDRVISDTQQANNNPNEDNDTRTNVEMELPIGETYTFYAFANLGGLKDGGTVINWIKSLSTSTTEADIQAKAVELQAMTNYNGGDNTAYIPMSSYGYTVTVSENNNSLSIPLIRLLGKVSLEVTNATGKKVNVDKITMGKFRTTGEIYLLPYDVKTVDNGQGNLMVGEEDETKLLNPSFPTENEEEGKDWVYEPTDENSALAAEETDDKNKQTYTFDINETGNQNQDNDGAGDITLSLDVSGIERDPAPQNTKFFFIRRNDLLKIPVLISNAKSKITIAQQHMPIGGLPTALFYGDGAIIADQKVELDHAGIVTIGYELTEVNNQTSGWSLKYYGGTFQPGDQYCCAQVEENSELADGKGLILVDYDDTDNESGESLWTNLPWISSSARGFALTPDKEVDGTTDSKTSGSFKVRIQELSSGTAKIKLTLVATKGTSEITLPYTITLKYKGGN